MGFYNKMVKACKWCFVNPLRLPLLKGRVDIGMLFPSFPIAPITIGVRRGKGWLSNIMCITSIQLFLVVHYVSPVIRQFVVFVLFLLLCSGLYAQRVGVVLSGGGSSGLAHVGVLKALEENNIPIDYITGTSMGAFVGGMYAMGYTPAQIEAIVLSEEFNSLVFSRIDDRYIYFFREQDPNVSWIGLKFRVDSSFHYTLPTSLISPVNMDFALMQRTASSSAAAGYDFDSLFVPYRCVAADIHNKREVVFDRGDLGQAIRASTTYPMYFKPIVVNGKLLFDGGLYNNFPADIMYRDFLPDIIIGSTVAAEMAPPHEDDIYSQIKNMVMERTSYTVVCDTGNMFIIRPVIPKVSILDFSRSGEMIQGGYRSTNEQMDRIRMMIDRRADPLALARKRSAFNAKKPPLIIDEIEVEGLNKKQAFYVNGVMRRKKLPVQAEELKPYFFRLASDDRIRHIYPITQRSASGNYRLNLNVKPDKDLYAQFGGLFSSRPINTGFIALRYKRISRIGMVADANAYFGKFYSSAQVKGTFDFPFKLPLLAEADFTLNNYDFFNSYSTFFEDTKPSYLIQYERSGYGGISIPVENHARIKTGITVAQIADDYYQTKQFLSADTADRTNFNHGSASFQFEHYTLNRKFYANSGSNFSLKFRYITGKEFNEPGSTSANKNEYHASHDFMRLRMLFDTYLNQRGRFKVGLYGEALLSNQPVFNNYTATILQAPAFSPVPESKTIFLPFFRAHNYVAGGLKTITSFTGRFDLRLEGYIFQPHREILEQPDQTASYGMPFQKRYIMASAALVYNTPIVPIALSLNYYQQNEHPFSFIFTLGYLIFNRKAMD